MLEYGQALWDVILNLLTFRITFQASTPTQLPNVVIRPVHSAILYSLFNPKVESIIREGLTTATVTLNREEEVTGLEDLSPGYQEEVKFLLTDVARNYFQDLGEIYAEEYFGLAFIYVKMLREAMPQHRIRAVAENIFIDFFCPHCFVKAANVRWLENIEPLTTAVKRNGTLVIPGLPCTMDDHHFAQTRSIESAIRSAFRRLLIDMAEDSELLIKHLRSGTARTARVTEIIETEEDLARAQHRSPFRWHEPPQYLIH